MSWKEFFRPTLWKIGLTALFFLVSVLSFFIAWGGQYWLIWIPAILGLWIGELLKNSLPFYMIISLILIYEYILANIIVYIFGKLNRS